VRHATEEDLDRVEPLLAELRRLPQLRERKRGSFSRGSRAFLHFHEDAGDFYVDVRPRQIGFAGKAINRGISTSRCRVTDPRELESTAIRWKWLHCNAIGCESGRQDSNL
jgi:hypothetical protein